MADFLILLLSMSVSGSILVLLLWGELEALGLQGFQLVIYP